MWVIKIVSYVRHIMLQFFNKSVRGWLFMCMVLKSSSLCFWRLWLISPRAQAKMSYLDTGLDFIALTALAR